MKSFVRTDSSTTGGEFHTRNKHLTTPALLSLALEALLDFPEHSFSEFFGGFVTQSELEFAD
jgi:hypothetical protein